MADKDEVVRLLIQYRSDLFAFILAAVRDRHVAEDIMQNIAVVICLKADQFESGTSFRSWSYEIARRQILGHHRKGKRLPQAMEPAEVERLAQALEEASEDRANAHDVRLEALEKCMESTSESVRKLLRFRYEQRLSLADVAEQIGAKPETVRKAIYRARIALRDCIDKRLGSSAGLGLAPALDPGQPGVSGA